MSDGYHGSSCLQFNPITTNYYTAIITQDLSVSSPILNHQYYGSLMFKSSDTFSLGNGGYSDTRYEWRYTDNSDGTLIFSYKDLAISSWTKISSIKSINSSTYLSNTWAVRNFQKGANESSYNDSLLLVDLTEAFGEGNEPDLSWCDKHIHYFDDSITATWNGISMTATTSNTRTSLNVDDINANDELEYTFIISSTTKPTSIDFNEIYLDNIQITDLGNNKYKINGIMTVTEYMITGLTTRDYAYDIMRFFDINGTTDIVIETAHIINYNHFYN